MLRHRHNPWRITATAVVFEGGLGVLALVAGGWLGHLPLPGIDWPIVDWPEQLRAVLWGAAATGPMLVGMWALDRCEARPLQQLKDDFERLIVPLFIRCNLLQLALISLTAGIGEELLFRGLLQAGLADWLEGPRAAWIALAAASIVFGLAHMISTTYAVIAALIGAYLGAIMLLTGNIVTPVVAHGLYDFVALLYLVHARGSDDC
jgi:membrane protease YdiL (CAAX protease family)